MCIIWHHFPKTCISIFAYENVRSNIQQDLWVIRLAVIFILCHSYNCSKGRKKSLLYSTFGLAILWLVGKNPEYFLITFCRGERQKLFPAHPVQAMWTPPLPGLTKGCKYKNTHLSNFYWQAWKEKFTPVVFLAHHQSLGSIRSPCLGDRDGETGSRVGHL